jgi:ribulose-5-phosphate 4-epimerase/fuculose-1-phosphate aldolase
MLTRRRDEGYIKFNCNWTPVPTVPFPQFEDLNSWRSRLYRAGLIGVYENRVGFGNVSVRREEGKNEFIISGTQTGGVRVLDESHYTLVLDFNIEKNELTCKGPVKASSESMTHAVFYQMSADINAVLHVHSHSLWRKLLDQVPTTAKNVAYGTPEMAKEVRRLFSDSNLKEKKVIVMGGHEDGVVTFGKDLNEAGNLLLECGR